MKKPLEVPLRFRSQHPEGGQELLPPMRRLLHRQSPSRREAAVDGGVPKYTVPILNQPLQHRAAVELGQGPLVSELGFQHVGDMHELMS
jgi:hypothetical protein